MATLQTNSHFEQFVYLNKLFNKGNAKPSDKSQNTEWFVSIPDW